MLDGHLSPDRRSTTDHPTTRREAIRRGLGLGLSTALSAGALLSLRGDGPPLDPPAPPDPTHPSGLAPPGDHRDWVRTFVDDFEATSLDEDRWGIYTEKPAGNSITYWRRSEVAVADSTLQLGATRVSARAWRAGGVSSAPAGGQRYGKWSVRMRMNPAAGVGYAILLYPVGGGWPPEIDFAEDSGGERRGYRATLHHSPDNRLITRRLWDIDLTGWHTVGVVVEPGRITYLIDDRIWARVESEHVPDEELWLGMQVMAHVREDDPEQLERSYVAASTPERNLLEIDWVARYARQDEVTRSASDPSR